jgi:HEAT repeat protein
MSAFARTLSLRPGESRLVLLVAGAFAAVEMGRGLGEVGVDTLVLSRTGADALPPLYVGLGLVGLVTTLGYGAILARSRSERFFPLLLLVAAGILALEWLVALSGAEAIFPALWISVYAVGLLLLTAMWTVAGYTFDARQAKRIFPLVTSAAISGSLAGFLGAIVVQRVVGAEQLILAEALLLIAAAALLSRLGGRARPRHQPGTASPSIRAALTAGGAYVARSPLMRLVALAYVLLAILLFSVTFPFMRAMGEAFPDEGELLTALALISAGVTAASFVIGTLLANRLYARFGVASVALVLPLVYALGFGLWLVRFTLTTAVVVRIAQQVTQRGLSNAAWSAFFSVIPARRRGQVMAFIDGVPGHLGTVLSGVLLILAASLAIEQVFLLGLVTAGACLVVVLLIRRAYARTLVATLREGLAEQVLEGGPGLAALGRDARVMDELRRATSSERPSERQLAAEILGRLASPGSTGAAAPAAAAASDLERLTGDEAPGVRRAALLALARSSPAALDSRLAEASRDPDASVRAAAVEALGRADGLGNLDPATFERLADDASSTVRRELTVALWGAGRGGEARAIVDGLLSSDDAGERAAGLEAVVRTGGDLGPSALAGHLADPSVAVRVAALRASAARHPDDAEPALVALHDPSPTVRAAAAEVLRDRPGAARAILEVLEGGPLEAQEAALAAIGGHVDEVRDALVAWAAHQVERATELRRHAAALRATDETPSASFLAQVIRRREAAIEGRLLTALAILGAPEASGLIRRCLRSVDPEVRAQAIEALDALGDARLARGVVRLLDSDIAPDGSPPADSLRSLAATRALLDDQDGWVRALALRTLMEGLRDEQRSLAERVRLDPEPVVRAAVELEEGAEPMSERLQLVSDIDRMLVLRRVPLFEALTPEDLQRVAVTAEERTWAAGEALMTEGDVGHELVVLVEGSVRVVRGDAADERVLRTFGVGDHIGELAVLREATRAATVIAEAPGVRGLVISGEAVQAILRERPEAAMAMLATLAERISQQSR